MTFLRATVAANSSLYTGIGIVVLIGALIAAAVALTATLSGCGGDGSGGVDGAGGSTPQNYTLTVSATSGLISQNTTLTLSVE
jgi:hypothetical protein